MKKLIDDAYLLEIISASRLFANAMPECILGIKNVNSEHIYISPYLLTLLNITLGDNKKVSIWPRYSLESTCKDDQDIIKKRESKSFLIFCTVDALLKPIMFVKTPIIHPETHQAVGLIYQGFHYEHFDLYKHINGLFSDLPPVENAPTKIPIKLSTRQKQVIFFFMAHLASQEIADQLSLINHKKIAKSTIDSIFSEQLYVKFNVVSRQQLYETLLLLGYDKVIPQSILKPSVTHGSDFLVI